MGSHLGFIEPFRRLLERPLDDMFVVACYGRAHRKARTISADTDDHNRRNYVVRVPCPRTSCPGSQVKSGRFLLRPLQSCKELPDMPFDLAQGFFGRGLVHIMDVPEFHGS